MNQTIVTRYTDDAEYLNYSKGQCMLCNGVNTSIEQRFTSRGYSVYVVHCHDCEMDVKTHFDLVSK